MISLNRHERTECILHVEDVSSTVKGENEKYMGVGAAEGVEVLKEACERSISAMR